jgi:hypothetical protein
MTAMSIPWHTLPDLAGAVNSIAWAARIEKS